MFYSVFNTYFCVLIEIFLKWNTNFVFLVLCKSINHWECYKFIIGSLTTSSNNLPFDNDFYIPTWIIWAMHCLQHLHKLLQPWWLSVGQAKLDFKCISISKFNKIWNSVRISVSNCKRILCYRYHHSQEPEHNLFVESDLEPGCYFSYLCL